MKITKTKLKQIIKEVLEEAEVIKFPGQDPLEPRKNYDSLSDEELLALAGKEFPPDPSIAPPKIKPGSPEEEEYEKLMAPRTPVQPEEEQYSEQERAKMMVWTYEQGGQDEISYKDYVDALLTLRKSVKHPHLQTHTGGKEV